MSSLGDDGIDWSLNDEETLKERWRSGNPAEMVLCIPSLPADDERIYSLVTHLASVDLHGMCVHAKHWKTFFDKDGKIKHSQDFGDVRQMPNNTVPKTIRLHTNAKLVFMLTNGGERGLDHTYNFVLGDSTALLLSNKWNSSPSERGTSYSTGVGKAVISFHTSMACTTISVDQRLFGSVHFELHSHRHCHFVCMFVEGWDQGKLDTNILRCHMPVAFVAFSRDAIVEVGHPMRALATILACMVMKRMAPCIEVEKLDARIRNAIQVLFACFDRSTDWAHFTNAFIGYKKRCLELWNQYNSDQRINRFEPIQVLEMEHGSDIEDGTFLSGAAGVLQCLDVLFGDGLYDLAVRQSSGGIHPREFYAPQQQERTATTSSASSNPRRVHDRSRSLLNEMENTRSGTLEQRVTLLENENAALQRQLLQLSMLIEDLQHRVTVDQLYREQSHQPRIAQFFGAALPDPTPYRRWHTTRILRSNTFGDDESFERFGEPGILSTNAGVSTTIALQDVIEHIERIENPRRERHPRSEDVGPDAITSEHLKKALNMLNDTANAFSEEQEKKATESVAGFLEVVNLPECQICCTDSVDCMLIECCHTNVCYKCVNRYSREVCPICRTRIDKIAKFREDVIVDVADDDHEEETRPSTEPASDTQYTTTSPSPFSREWYDIASREWCDISSRNGEA